MMYHEVDTPSVVIDLDLAKNNIRRFQDYCDQYGLDCRPHIKTHKLASLTELQLRAGAVGINCQKLSEAKSIANACPVDDVLITYNIVGTHKLIQLEEFSRQVNLSVVADSMEVVSGLSKTFSTNSSKLKTFVECDTGAGRCGVISPVEALQLAQQIDRSAGLEFAGLMTFPPIGKTREVNSWLAEAKLLIEQTGIAVAKVSSGGSPDMFCAHEAPTVTEYRAGTYVYYDRSLVEHGTCSWDECALSVLATVVSRPTQNRAIIDAGSKVLTSDTMGLRGYGHVLGRPDISIDQLSEEHGRLVSKQGIGLQIGDRVRVVPNHACVVSNMLDHVVVVENGIVSGTEPVVARGQVW